MHYYKTAILNCVNPIVKNFLVDQEFKRDIEKFIFNPCEESFSEINNAFQLFYFKVKCFAYFAKIIPFEVKNLDKKTRTISNRNPLVLDASLSNQENTSLIDLIADETSSSITDLIDHYSVLKSAILTLTDRQKLVIEYYYLNGYKEKEIAKALKVSPQAISKTKRQALDKLRRELSDG